MARGKTRKKRGRATPKKRRPQPDHGWQLWAVGIGVAVVVGFFLWAVSRHGAPAQSAFEGAVVAKETLARPGQFDRLHLRRLTLEGDDGVRTTVEVEAWLYDAVEEGFLVRRSEAGEVTVHDENGQAVDPVRPASPDG